MRLPPPSPRPLKHNVGVGFGLLADQRGVTAIEYALIAGLIAIAAVAILVTMGGQVSAPFSTIAGRL